MISKSSQHLNLQQNYLSGKKSTGGNFGNTSFERENSIFQCVDLTQKSSHIKNDSRHDSHLRLHRVLWLVNNVKLVTFLVWRSVIM